MSATDQSAIPIDVLEAAFDNKNGNHKSFIEVLEANGTTLEAQRGKSKASLVRLLEFVGISPFHSGELADALLAYFAATDSGNLNNESISFNDVEEELQAEIRGVQFLAATQRRYLQRWLLGTTTIKTPMPIKNIERRLPCCACGAKRSTATHVLRTHADLAQLGLELSSRNWIPLCGTMGKEGTCHHAFDQFRLFFVAYGSDGIHETEGDNDDVEDEDARKWVAVRLMQRGGEAAAKDQQQETETIITSVVTIPTDPHRRALHDHAKACQVLFDFGAITQKPMSDWLNDVTPHDSPPESTSSEEREEEAEEEEKRKKQK